MTASLTIALSTVGDRAASIDLNRLPAGSDWQYLIICQTPDGSADAGLAEWKVCLSAHRPEVKVVMLTGFGVAASRNAALALCETEILLFADDDAKVLPAGVAGLIAAFASNPRLDIIAGRTLLADGSPEKRYPPRREVLSVFNSARIGTVELAVRPRRIRDRGIRFDPAFGAGRDNFLGDEYIFVADGLRAGLRGEYLPIDIAVHEGTSSGLDFSSAAAAHARARVFERVFEEPLALLVKLAFLWRHRTRIGSLWSCWQFARAFLPRQWARKAPRL